jgi:hypothetical protein
MWLCGCGFCLSVALPVAGFSAAETAAKHAERLKARSERAAVKAAAKETRKEQSRAARKVHKDGKKGKTRDPVVAEYGALCGCCAACAH